MLESYFFEIWSTKEQRHMSAKHLEFSAHSLKQCSMRQKCENDEREWAWIRKHHKENCPLINNLYDKKFRLLLPSPLALSSPPPLPRSQFCLCQSLLRLNSSAIQCNHLIHNNLFLIMVNPHVLNPIAMKNFTCALITHFYSFAIAWNWMVFMWLRLVTCVSLFILSLTLSPHLFPRYFFSSSLDFLFLSKHRLGSTIETHTSKWIHEIDKFKFERWLRWKAWFSPSSEY